MTSINRRDAAKGLAATAAFASVSSPSVLRAQTTPKNVIGISIDDLNDWVSFLQGYPLITPAMTPNLHALAALAAVMGRAYDVSPYCCSSRNAKWWGLYPWRTGVYAQGEDWMDGSQIASGQIPMPMVFRTRGYACYGVGKNFHSGWRFTDNTIKKQYPSYPSAFDYYEPCNKAPGVCSVTDEKIQGGILDSGIGPDYPFANDTQRARWAIETVIRPAKTKPTFLAIGLNGPHTQWRASAEELNRFNLSDIVYPLGVQPEDRRDDVTYETFKDNQDIPSISELLSKSHGQEELDEIIRKGLWRFYIRYYLAEIVQLDRVIGEILTAWQDPSSGMNSSNTLLYLWSDHGWQLGEKLAWHKFTLWERANRIPCLFAGPGVTPGYCPTPFSTIDIFPTICEMAFGEVPDKAELGKFALDGVSRASWMTSPTASRTNRALMIWNEKFDEADVFQKNPSNAHLSIVTNEFGMGPGGKGTRYIQYDGGDAEYYDPSDQWEWYNRRERPTAEVVSRCNYLSTFFPNKDTFAPRAKFNGGEDD